MHLKNMLDNILGDFRSECLECTKFTHRCQNQIFPDHKKVLRIACIASHRESLTLRNE